MKRTLIICAAVLAVAGATAVFPVTLRANNSWGGYHWARISNPFTLKVGDNVDNTWQGYLETTVGFAPSGWTSPYPHSLTINSGNDDVVHMTLVPGRAKPRNCRPTSGRVEVCNATYGSNGWLGVAQIWVSGSHITQGTVKLNDTYFNTAAYDSFGWRQMVTCQEVGHTIGLDHQDEAFNNPNLGTCMDYTNDPTRNDGNGSNLYPNQHDFDELVTIYSHADSSTTAFTTLPPPAMNDIQLEGPGQWGRQLRSNGRVALFDADFGNGHHVFTFVIYA